MTATDPLVEALARTILRYQLGCGQPAEPPTWMVAAATEIAVAVRGDGLPLSILCSNCHAPDLEDITEALEVDQ